MFAKQLGFVKGRGSSNLLASAKENIAIFIIAMFFLILERNDIILYTSIIENVDILISSDNDLYKTNRKLQNNGEN